MSDHIEMTFDYEIQAFVISMPEFVTFSVLELWRVEFLRVLCVRPPGDRVALLLDSRQHNFESIQCLKLLRDVLSNEPQVTQRISTFAFVAPAQYRAPGIVSPMEAYFARVDEARKWLSDQMKTDRSVP